MTLILYNQILSFQLTLQQVFLMAANSLCKFGTGTGTGINIHRRANVQIPYGVV
ncbi:predicted protein [Sclerotinia sclerotiorum 1980 UF-70]|uniref:Uncharacterized protein n=1 Tax=Sclerotinia sclerotiorum (strain ATCC 18683 / 1980 / Ss-1) TaxID=665079 RepID=A7EDB4_SCLS1|nr:predicted protein [Sclerotinia sclerotiorum 1980 UF-70]EDO00830.1 predicted protein [Sclerotinia sclerotiorum 1980 UF-70]